MLEDPRCSALENFPEHRILSSQGGEELFDVLLVNIVAGPLLLLAPLIASLAKPGGHLVLSGWMGFQRDQILQTYAALGFEDLEVVGSEGKWGVMAGRMMADSKNGKP